MSALDISHEATVAGVGVDTHDTTLSGEEWEIHLFGGNSSGIAEVEIWTNNGGGWTWRRTVNLNGGAGEVVWVEPVIVMSGSSVRIVKTNGGVMPVAISTWLNGRRNVVE